MPPPINKNIIWIDADKSLIKWIISSLVESGIQRALDSNKPPPKTLENGAWPAIRELLGALDDSEGLVVHNYEMRAFRNEFRDLVPSFKETQKQDLPPRPDFLPDHILPASMGLIDVKAITQATRELLDTMTEEKVCETKAARYARHVQEKTHREKLRTAYMQQQQKRRDLHPVILLYTEHLTSGNDSDRSNPCEKFAIYHADRKQFFHLGSRCWSDNKDGSNIDPESSQHSEPRQDVNCQEPIEKPPNFGENVKWNCHTECWCYEDGMIYYPSAKKFQNPLDGVLSDNQDGSNNQYSHREHPC
ncbi:hypothetical protein EYC80_002420 [Monilinia laxa]|uniref:Uncharacterized protein n=1 Tax=Monilinia laxa TaxID=61186 RepID=A0A5N6K3Q9_MONLA|nr:hypothetical protein EYC80_002420 [Monilinia laxa]